MTTKSLPTVLQQVAEEAAFRLADANATAHMAGSDPRPLYENIVKIACLHYGSAATEAAFDRAISLVDSHSA